MTAEGLHQGFNLSSGQWIPFSSQIHYVSELGVGSTAPIFNISTIILGLTIAGASYLFYIKDKRTLFSSLLFIAGIGAIGVGAFPTNIQPIHGIFQLFALMFGAFSAILSYRKQQAPISYISAVLGTVSFVTSIVFYPYLGLGDIDIGRAGQQAVIPEKAIAVTHNLEDTAAKGVTLLFGLSLEQLHNQFWLFQSGMIGDTHLLGQLKQLVSSLVF
jgi:hypothetical membrane protein